MSPTTEEAFDEFDENLKLDLNERLSAIKVHNEITSLLIDKQIIVDAFLQGSFRRKTMIAPLRDVDKVVILHGDLEDLSPDEVMDRIQEVVEVEYPDVTFDRSRHALQIDFGDDSFYFDTVPAWESTTDDDDVCIANRDSGGWQSSNTRQLIRVIAERNQDTGGKFIHQARMGKQVIKHLLDGSIPGLHVEAWAHDAIVVSMAHDEALARIIEIGASLLGTIYYEPTGVEAISARLKPDVVEHAKTVLADAALRAREARDLTDADDHNEAIRIWHSICGECFPEAEEQDDASALGQSFQGGAITSSGTVSSSRTTGQTSRPVRPWRAI